MTGLALDTPVATSAGWLAVRDLEVGDEVFDADGARARVLSTSAVNSPECYRVTFANGASIVCGAGHLWVARASRGSVSWKAHATADLATARAAGKSVVMQVAKPLDLPDATLPIDPWLLGYWLGDGTSTRPVVTCNVANQHEIVAAITSAGYEVGSVYRKKNSNGVAVYVRGAFVKQLADAGLMGSKHVPAEYLRASARQRLALVRGLLDSDGHVNKERGRAQFFNTDIGLAKAAAELARSLGEMVNVRVHEAKGYGKTVTSYRVSWQPSVEPVTTSAKLANYRPRTFAPYRSIKSIERVPPEPVRCISVDSATGTFLAGEDMAPTHGIPRGRKQAA